MLRDQTSLMLMCISGEHFSMDFCDAIQVRGLLYGDLFTKLKSSYMCYKCLQRNTIQLSYFRNINTVVLCIF